MTKPTVRNRCGAVGCDEPAVYFRYAVVDVEGWVRVDVEVYSCQDHSSDLDRDFTRPCEFAGSDCDGFMSVKRLADGSDILVCKEHWWQQHARRRR